MLATERSACRANVTALKYDDSANTIAYRPQLASRITTSSSMSPTRGASGSSPRPQNRYAAMASTASDASNTATSVTLLSVTIRQSHCIAGAAYNQHQNRTGTAHPQATKLQRWQ